MSVGEATGKAKRRTAACDERLVKQPSARRGAFNHRGGMSSSPRWLDLSLIELLHVQLSQLNPQSASGAHPTATKYGARRRCSRRPVRRLDGAQSGRRSVR